MLSQTLQFCIHQWNKGVYIGEEEYITHCLQMQVVMNKKDSEAEEQCDAGCKSATSPSSKAMNALPLACLVERTKEMIPIFSGREKDRKKLSEHLCRVPQLVLCYTETH